MRNHFLSCLIFLFVRQCILLFTSVSISITKPWWLHFVIKWFFHFILLLKDYFNFLLAALCKKQATWLPMENWKPISWQWCMDDTCLFTKQITKRKTAYKKKLLLNEHSRLKTSQQQQKRTFLLRATLLSRLCVHIF